MLSTRFHTRTISRANKEEVTAFIQQHEHKIAGFYIENESETKAEHPELERLINDSHNAEVLVIENNGQTDPLILPAIANSKIAYSRKGTNHCSCRPNYD